MNELKANYKVLAALLAVYIIWGSTYLGIKYAVETIPPFLHAALRFTISGGFLFAWRALTGDPLPTGKQWWSAAVVGTLLLVGGNGLISLSETKIPSGVAALIVASMPIFMVLINFTLYRSQKPTLIQILGLLIGFGGVFYLLNPWNNTGDVEHFSITYGLVALLASFLWSLGSVYSRQAQKPTSLLMFTGMQMLAGSIGLYIMSMLFGEFHGFHLSQVSNNSWLGFAYLVTFGSLIGFTSYSYLLQHASVSLISTYPYVNPIVAIILGNLLAGESLNSRIIISAMIIIASIALINWQKK